MEPKATTTMAMTGAGTTSSESDVKRAEPASEVVSIPRMFMGELTTHTDGIGLMSVLRTLLDHGVFDYFAGKSEAGQEHTSLGEIVERFGANPGYLNVVMRALSSQGWLEREPALNAEDTRFKLTHSGGIAVELLRDADCLASLKAFIPAAAGLRDLLREAARSDEARSTYESLVDASEREWDLPDADGEEANIVRQQILAHLDGNLLGPTVIALKDRTPGGRDGVLDQLNGAEDFVDVALLEGRSGGLTAAFKLLERKGWITSSGNRVALTEKGQYATKRGWSYGVPTSYMLTYAAIDELLFGDPEVLRQGSPGDPELHVDRAMNVKGSGGAHGAYFGAIDQVIVDRFNLPFEDQPLGFADMGCGDGTWLEHVYHLVMDSTERGRLIRENPDDRQYDLVLVGADYNPAALEITRAKLDGANIPHLAVFGDVNDPAGFRQILGRSRDRFEGPVARKLIPGAQPAIHATGRRGGSRGANCGPPGRLRLAGSSGAQQYAPTKPGRTLQGLGADRGQARDGHPGPSRSRSNRSGPDADELHPVARAVRPVYDAAEGVPLSRAGSRTDGARALSPQIPGRRGACDDQRELLHRRRSVGQPHFAPSARLLRPVRGAYKLLSGFPYAYFYGHYPAYGQRLRRCGCAIRVPPRVG